MYPSEYVVLVDETDKELGIEEKMAAHQKALLHRAFSVFIYRHSEEVQFLLQQRNKAKYHCGGLWSNTCCSHPRPGETVEMAAKRRLKEEMNIEVPLQNIGSFQYKAIFENGLTEHELDHVLVGEYDASQTIIGDPCEVQDYRWIGLSQLQTELGTQAKEYTPWFKQALSLVLEELCLNC
jgi:isopentenyl-diphosphate delta-isomerase